MKDNIIAIDLHGTLIDQNWHFPSQLINEFSTLYYKLNESFDFYICTGNNLDFVIRYLPDEILSLFKGFILETGGVFSDGVSERLLIEPSLIKDIEKLKKEIEKQEFGFIKYFAERKASISAFTQSETEGESPEKYFKIIEEFVLNSDLSDKVYTTYSNVAIDIIPIGVSKFTGIDSIRSNQTIISLLDSMNDIDLALHSNLCFLPSNASKELLNRISYNSINSFQEHVKICDFKSSNTIFLCNNSFSFGVIEALEVLASYY